MCVLKKPELKQLGFIWGPANSMFETTWLQFADDAALISNCTKDAQQLLNIFTAWCTWAGMQIRLDKSSSFGMQKQNTKYEQFEPTFTAVR